MEQIPDNDDAREATRSGDDIERAIELPSTVIDLEGMEFDNGSQAKSPSSLLLANVSPDDGPVQSSSTNDGHSHSGVASDPPGRRRTTLKDIGRHEPTLTDDEYYGHDDEYDHDNDDDYSQDNDDILQGPVTDRLNDSRGDGSRLSSYLSMGDSNLNVTSDRSMIFAPTQSMDSLSFHRICNDPEAPISFSEVTPKRRTLRPGITGESGHYTFSEIMQRFRSASGRRLSGPQQRLAQRIDLETGREVTRTQCAVIRDGEERHPQIRRRRLQKQAKKVLTVASVLGSDAEDGAQNPSGNDQQYRLFTVDSSLRGDRGPFNISAASLQQMMGGDDDRGCACFGFQPNRVVVSYLFWAFRSSFLALFLSATAWFFIYTLCFAIIIYLIGRRTPECIAVSGGNFDKDGGPYFMDAYALSWTTFSTVGYGVVHPATSATTENVRKCFLITIICSWEAFVGILMGSMWSAIFLSKVTRISSFAQVTFSTSIVIRYGVGVGSPVEDEDDNNGTDSSEEDFRVKSRRISGPRVSHSELSRMPCPVLEFRIVNRLHSRKKGEIIDASLSVAASVDATQLEQKVKLDDNKKRDYSRRKSSAGGFVRTKDLLYQDLPKRVDWDSAHSMIHQMLKEAENITHHPAGVEYTEFDGGELDFVANLANRKVFSRVAVESGENPFFQRIWTGKHILDHDSPLLKPEVKKLIRMNQGHWPKILDSPSGVRASVKFDQILVSLSGTSNADCNSVYAQKFYSYEDLCVGYKFANMLYRSRRGYLKVDESLINDVVEQTGGGGEDLFARDHLNMSTHDQIFIL